MKTYFLSLFIILGFLATQAQEIIIPLEDQFSYNNNTDTPVYFKDVNNKLDKFTGNWVFDDGTHYLKISITKKTHIAVGLPPIYNDPNFEDYLSVTMIYKLNGVEIYNTTSVSSTDARINGNIINNSNEIKLNYYEPTASCRRQKSADLTLEFVTDGTLVQDGSLPEGSLNWKRKNRSSGIPPVLKCPDGSFVDSSEYKIPANLTLEREL